MKKCPYCAEEIQDSAIKCRWCGSDLNTKPEQAGGATSKTYIANAQIGKKKMLQGGGMMLVSVILIIIGAQLSITFLVVFGVFSFIMGLVYVISGKFENWKHWG